MEQSARPEHQLFTIATAERLATYFNNSNPQGWTARVAKGDHYNPSTGEIRKYVVIRLVHPEVASEEFDSLNESGFWLSARSALKRTQKEFVA